MGVVTPTALAALIGPAQASRIALAKYKREWSQEAYSAWYASRAIVRDVARAMLRAEGLPASDDDVRRAVSRRWRAIDAWAARHPEGITTRLRAA